MNQPIDRDTLVKALKAHDFGELDRFGNPRKVIIETMDGPVGRISGFSHEVTAGTRKHDDSKNTIEHFISEIEADLDALAGQPNLKYGVAIFWIQPGMVRYAKATNIEVNKPSVWLQTYLDHDSGLTKRT